MTDVATGSRRNWWSIGLWVAQVFLAFFYAFAGYSKVFTPIADLAAMMAWAPRFSTKCDDGSSERQWKARLNQARFGAKYSSLRGES